MENLMEMIGLLGEILLIYYCVPVLPLSLLIWWIGRKRAQWAWSDLLIVVLPPLVWAVVFACYTSDKGWGNQIEPAFLAGVFVPLALARVFFVPRWTAPSVRTLCLVLGCLFAVMTWWLVPNITGE